MQATRPLTPLGLHGRLGGALSAGGAREGIDLMAGSNSASGWRTNLFTAPQTAAENVQGAQPAAHNKTHHTSC